MPVFLVSLFTNVKFIIGLVITVLIIGVVVYIRVQANTIERLRQDNATLQVAVQEQQKTIEALKRDFAAINEAKDRVGQKEKDLQNQIKKLKDQLFREQHGKTSIEDLILQDKKGEIKTQINSEKDKFLRCLEIMTGSPLKDGEIIDCNG